MIFFRRKKDEIIVPVDYNIKIFGNGDFELKLVYKIPKKVFRDALRNFCRKRGIKEFKLPEEGFKWKVAKQAVLNLFSKYASNTLRKVTEDIRKDKPNFAILLYDVKDVEYKIGKGEVECHVLVKGVCSM